MSQPEEVITPSSATTQSTGNVNVVAATSNKNTDDVNVVLPSSVISTDNNRIASQKVPGGSFEGQKQQKDTNMIKKYAKRLYHSFWQPPAEKPPGFLAICKRLSRTQWITFLAGIKKTNSIYHKVT